MNILDKIIIDKKREVALKKSIVPVSQLEVSVLAVLVEEYRNGVLIGSVVRDIQIQVINCGSNAAPEISGIDNVPNVFDISTCPNTNICFKITIV